MTDFSSSGWSDIIVEATNRWIDKNRVFTVDDLMGKFPWMNKELAKEEIASWSEQKLVVFEDGVVKRTNVESQTKLLFLDVDGVLNHSRSKDSIDDACLDNLSHIIQKTGALIILISSWRAGWYKTEKEFQDDDATYLDRRLKEVGLFVTDKSSRYVGSRVVSVIDWVMRYDAVSWVILDDDAWQYQDCSLSHICVATNDRDGGLTASLAERAIETLNKMQ